MKLCKNGHPIGTVEVCRPCQISRYVRARWGSPTQRMLAASGDVTGLQTEAARAKRAAYFASDEHRDKARAQARKLAEERRSGVRNQVLVRKSGTKPELAVAAILDKLGLEYRVQEPVGPYLFDFYLPSHKILIEVDGEYFHSRPESITNDLAKESYIRSQCPDVKLVRISELDTLKIGCVDRRLIELVGRTTKTTRQIDLSECTIGPCPAQEALSFMSVYHYLPRFRKSTRHTHAIRHNNEIIAVIVYSMPSYQTVATKYGCKPSRVLELARFVIADDCHIKNLASWSLSKSLKLLDCDVVVSYSDPHFGFRGSIYRAANWESAGFTRPSYYYLDSMNSIIHKKTVWDHAQKMGVKIDEYAATNGLRRVDSEPKEVFVYRLRKPTTTGVASTKPSITTRCETCKNEVTITEQAFRLAVKKRGHYRCLGCSIAENWRTGAYDKRCRRSEHDSNEVVNAVCDCGLVRPIKRKSLNYAVRKHGRYVCASCAVKKAITKMHDIE